MPLTSEDVKKIARLARLSIGDDDIRAYTKNLTDILTFVEQMNSVDTTGVVPMAHPMDAHQRLRKDEVIEENERENFQKIAPQTKSGLYLVPRVIE